MSILDRVGLSPKQGARPRRSGLRLEGRGGATAPPLTRAAVGRRAALLVGLVGLALLAFPRVQFYENRAETGDVWRSEDVVAPFNFPLRVPERELDAQRDSIRFEEPAVFVEVPDALDRTLARLDTLDARLDAALGAYAGWQAARARGQGEAAAADSARFLAFRARVPTPLSDRQWSALLASYASRDGVAPAPSRAEEGGPSLEDRVLREAARAASELLPRGVLDTPSDSILADQIAVRPADLRLRVERLVPRAAVLGEAEALDASRTRFEAAFEGRRDTVEIGVAFFRAALAPSLRYDRAATEARWAEGMADVRPTRGLIREGITIVRTGDEVTPEVFAQLQSLEVAQRERSGDISRYRTRIGQTLLVLAAYTIFFLYLYLLRRQVFDDFRALALISLLFGLTVVGYAIAVRSTFVGELAVPVALVSILLTVLFDSRVGMFGTVTLAVLGGLIFGYEFEFTFATLFAGLLAVFSVRDVRNRSQLVLSAALVLVAYAVVIGGYALLRADPLDGRLELEVISVLVNASILLFAAPLLWGIERAFGVTTDLALLELSDTNRPLLKELSLRAPGTFNHVLQVANLAEAAADAVGANALRARVGALYHDVGKMLKPEYYVENQQAGENPHDRITPYMSALIVASHVRDGVALAREHGLPEPILDFIPTHHGTTLMEYFYRRAVDAVPPDGEPVDEAEFRYPGPRPQTSEQAIVMLADSVEAASRSLTKPTPRRLEALIDGLLRARMDDGQLSQSPLTFADVSRIRETFLSILCGIYHFRVKYPGQDEEVEEPAPDGTAERAADPDTPAGDGAPPALSQAEG